ncbi:hypothetical protein NW754_007689 [Fusarium falciforme]|uniref:Uncharacterized protein n=1 Tax=Fusarium falciforme TaxID=195108 RepID=A0A9W8R378_9HYPO|nr:hypothetical protein NW754_007689 [Fusarium falciforme]KAJ4186441.1 hypothetical protein NW755_007736 [Fusarium falciforme]KAJ4248586.1 hypothetical protein NW757_008234 [Fusarium falciforme]
MNLLLAVKIMITHYFVKVEPDKNNPEDAVDWESMKAAIEVAKADIEKRFEEGILEKERRDCYIELPKALLEGHANPPPSPPKEYRREYKKGKWDDI